MPERNMLVSVIVPIYNIELYLEKCIVSIIRQSYIHLQILLVNDGSKDSSGQIADAYAAKDSRIQVIHKKNGGLVSARKAGIEAAGGEYVCFVDGDDWIENDTIESMVKCLEGNEDADMILFGYQEDVCGKVYPRMNQLAPGIYGEEQLKKQVFPKPLTQGEFYSLNIQPFLWNKMFRRELGAPHILAVDDKIRIGEDVAAVLPILLSSKKIIVTEDCKYHYCMRLSSMMHHREKLEQEREELKVLHQYLLNKSWMYERGLQKDQISKLAMNNILTRIYPLIADRNGQCKLWPFPCVEGDREFIIYGAGNFGQALYSYLYQKAPHKVVLWVDQKFEEYGEMGFPVDDPHKVISHRECDVFIAILDKAVEKVIVQYLLSKGFEKERIHCVCISMDDIATVLRELEFE